MSEAGLEMQWQRVIDLASDTMLLQVSLEAISLRALDRKLIVDVPRLIGHYARRGNRNIHAGQKTAVDAGVPLTLLRPRIQMPELHP